MIGDNERMEEEPDPPMLGPLYAMVRLNPPEDPPFPAWIERYETTVVIRHTHSADGSGVTREIYCASTALAVVRYARAVAELKDRGYQVVNE